MIKRIAVFSLLVAFAGFAFAQGTTQQWVEGKNYFAIPNPQPTNHPDKVVVTEVFSFGCPVCNRFQPFMDKLEAELPANTVMEFLPAGWSKAEDWPMLQRAYYAAKALGVDSPKSRDATFHAIWGPNGPLATYDPTTQRPKSAANLPTIEDVAKFYAQFGAKPDQFVSASQSFAVNMDVKRAEKQILAWGITGTPTLVIDGKWRADMGSAGGPQQLVDLALYLINKEQATKQAK